MYASRSYLQNRNYTSFASASISTQRAGLGVDIGDVVHARDLF